MRPAKPTILLKLAHKKHDSAKPAGQKPTIFGHGNRLIDSICEGDVIRNNEIDLEEFYSELVNCKMVLEAAGAHNLLNSASTAKRVFARLPRDLQRSFAELVVQRGYDMDILCF